MAGGLTAPRAHPGLSDQAGGGNGGGGFLSVMYQAGLLDDPSDHNRLVGDYFNTYFAEDGHVAIAPNVYDDGSGGNQHPVIELERWFSNRAANGLVIRRTAQYEPEGDFGAMHDDFAIRDAVGNTDIIVREHTAYTYSPVPTWYYPTFAPIDSDTVRILTMQRRGSLGGTFEDVHTFSADGSYLVLPRLPNVVTPQTQAVVFAQVNREGGGMFAGQGAGWWAKGRDSAGFLADVGRWNFVWDDPNVAGPIGEFNIDLWGSGAWQRAMTLTPSLVTFGGSLDVGGLLESTSLLVDDADVLDDLTVGGDVDVVGDVTAATFNGLPLPTGGVAVSFYGTVGVTAYVKPSNARFVEVFMQGNGGAGGSGRRGAAGGARGGGGGGGASTALWVPFLATQLPASATVTIGAAGTGGAAVAVDTTNGNPGNAGADISFATGSLVEIGVHPGGPGGGGTAAGGAAGAVGFEFGLATARLTASNSINGGTGGAGGAAGAPGNGSGGAISADGLVGTGGAGGGGGGITAGNAGSAGGTGGAGAANRSATPAAGTAGSGATPGGAGGAVTGDDVGGGGGGGGGASDGTGRAGGAGGARGGGGGGGAASVNGTASGAGGDGALGGILVIAYAG